MKGQTTDVAQSSASFCRRHLIVSVDRVHVLKPTGDLLGRPLQPALACHDLGEFSVSDELADLRATGSFPSKFVSIVRPITLHTSVSLELTTNSGWGTSEPVRNRAHRITSNH